MKSDPEHITIYWVIYDHPDDFPDYWVVRRWYKIRDGIGIDLIGSLHDTLESAHEAIPKTAISIGCEPGDSPCICEIWT